MQTMVIAVSRKVCQNQQLKAYQPIINLQIHDSSGQLKQVSRSIPHMQGGRSSTPDKNKDGGERIRTPGAFARRFGKRLQCFMEVVILLLSRSSPAKL